MNSGAAVQVLDRALALLTAIAADTGRSSLSGLATQLAIAPATAHRIAATLEQRGFIVRVGRGRFMLGAALIGLVGPQAHTQLLTALGAPIVRELARQAGLASHLGVFEGDMVTYLAKAGRDAKHIFTQEGMQLEAYCSAIGKALLAHLPTGEQRRYLRAGPFVRLTPNTIVEPQRLEQELQATRERGYAIDDCEVDSGLCCVAAPVFDPSRRAIAALSISKRTNAVDELADAIPALRQAALDLETKLAGSVGLNPASPPPPRPREQ